MAKLSPQQLVFTSPFGPRAPNQAIGITEDMHWGADYGPDVRNKKGVPLQSLIDGSVTPLSDQYGALGVRTTTKATGSLLNVLRSLYGNVREGTVVSVSLWHLASRVALRTPNVVAGAVLGVMGSTGRSTGVHVHVELRIDGRLVDPKPFIDAQASKAVADAPADYYEEDDVALTVEEKRALEWLFANAAGLEELIKRRSGIDAAATAAKKIDGIATTVGENAGALRVMGAWLEQLFIRRATFDRTAVQVAAIHADLPEIKQARDVSLDADDIALLAASIASTMPKPDAQALIDALAAQLAKP
ncbi:MULTISPECIES: M23 family metallopeptidase [unclassified Agrococcus]|uniref:M23 family metallopeptidase n=1 Tax=unclassified Agrococcus TaxID=2615065 RepID=UPI003617F216